ncbi:sensor histidine kinase [Paenibacillus sp. CAA11]|uniref:sensor histidine kinase n=1 Tax=Paenibacillus sp. CAA11 TaxID=1532905 RepID=UPI000D335112|nr:sensor histidine kinase [Paenibacillus sp. CAA11]AWB46209.1 sensor histidine kinase [Paenibacillus sp. CAA11]
MKLSLNDVRLRDKMLLLYFLAVFVPILVTNLIFYHVTTTSVKDKRMEDITRAMEQVKNEFLREVEDAVEISSVYYTDHLLNEILDKKYENPADYVAAYDSYLRRIVNSFSPVYNSVAGISIYVDNPTLLYSGGVYYIDDAVKQEPWYSKVADSRQSAPMILRTGQGETENTFSVIRRMDYFYYSKDENGRFLKIDLRMPYIRKIFSNLNLQADVYLLNKQGEIEFTTQPGLELGRSPLSFGRIPQPEHTLEFTTGYSKGSFLDGWSLVGRINEDEVFREVRQSRNFVIVLTLLNILLPTLIIVWITRSLNVRLVRILKHMKKVKNQHFVTIKEAGARDEIGQLTGEFNRMTLQIKSLIDNVYMADIQKKSLELERRHAQLNALQSQINPHFLFNALETIRMRSVMKDEDETARIIHKMSKILRNSLVWRKDMITLKEELEFIFGFLEIQKYRFGDKLDYRIEVDKALHGCLIPKMSIVTFVENASIHGIEPLKEGGFIAVKIVRTGQELAITVEDNGVGMTPEKVSKLLGYLDTDEAMGERIGIQNVIYRLKMYYESQFKLQILSSVSEGTMIRLNLPLEE